MLIRKKFPIILLAVCLIAFISAFLVPCDFTLAAAGDKVFDIIEITDFHGMLEDTKGNPVAAVIITDVEGNAITRIARSDGSNCIAACFNVVENARTAVIRGAVIGRV
jgi:hypothetical protein